MAPVYMKSHTSSSRGRVAHLIGLGVASWFVISCVRCNTCLVLVKVSAASEDFEIVAPVQGSSKQRPSISADGLERVELPAAIDSPRHDEETLLPPVDDETVSLHDTSEDDSVQEDADASGWWGGKLLSKISEWIRYFLGVPVDHGAELRVPRVLSSSDCDAKGTKKKRDSRKGASADKMGSGCGTQDTKKKRNKHNGNAFDGMEFAYGAKGSKRVRDKHTGPPSDALGSVSSKSSTNSPKGTIESVSTNSSSSIQCTTPMCQQIAGQLRRDMNHNADPCMDVNEYYCGNWVRHTKESAGVASELAYMDSTEVEREHVLIGALSVLKCPADVLGKVGPQEHSERGDTNEAKKNSSISSSKPTDQSSTSARTSTQDEWDSLLGCAYQTCMDEHTVEYRGAKPLFAAMFDSHGGAASLSFLIESNFEKEVEAAVQADKLATSEDKPAETGALRVYLKSLIVAAGGSSTDAVGDSTPASFDTKNDKETKNLLKILVPRLRSIYKRMNAQFFWSLFTGPHELDAEMGHTLTIADLILGLPYDYYEMKYEDRQFSYKRYLARLLRAFDIHLAQYRRGIYETGMEFNSNMKLDYNERARRIFSFEANILRKLVIPPRKLHHVDYKAHVITFGQLKKTAKFLDVEAIVRMFLEDVSLALFSPDSPTPELASRMARFTRTSRGITITEKGEVAIGDNAEFIIDQKNYFSRIEEVLYDPKNWAVLHDYILVNLIRNQAKLLSDDFSSASDEYVSSVGLSILPRSHRCLQALPEWLLGRLYVRETTSEQKKPIVADMVHNLILTLAHTIKQFTWMDRLTRDKALRKLEALTYKVGYPDWLLDSKSSQFYFEKYYGNSKAALAATRTGYYEFIDYMRRQVILAGLRNYGALPSSQEWDTPPHEPRGAYLRNRNEILITAAFLEKPMMFVPSRETTAEELVVSKALNYGGLGAFIGHELIHAVDSGGGEFDEDGRVRSWWIKAMETAFAEKLECFENQYSKYSIELNLSPVAGKDKPANQSTSPARSVDSPDTISTGAQHPALWGKTSHVPPQHLRAAASEAGRPETRGRPIRSLEEDLLIMRVFLDGAKTVEENFADNAGLQMAWATAKKQLTAEQLNEQPLKSLRCDFTVKKLFLYAWGHFWCEVTTPESLAKRMRTTRFTPSRFRSEGALANFDLFAEEYQCPLNTPLNPEKKCRIV